MLAGSASDKGMVCLPFISQFLANLIFEYVGTDTVQQLSGRSRSIHPRVLTFIQPA